MGIFSFDLCFVKLKLFKSRQYKCCLRIKNRKLHKLLAIQTQIHMCTHLTSFKYLLKSLIKLIKQLTSSFNLIYIVIRNEQSASLFSG